MLFAIQRHLLASAVASILLVALPASALPVTWGSFDSSRIANPDRTLTGSLYSTFREVIDESGGVLATPTDLLSASYLAGIDVLYTGLLSSTTFLSSAEQTALESWIAGGGTLIASYDTQGTTANNGMLATYGVQWGVLGLFPEQLSPVASHRITGHIDQVRVFTGSSLAFGPDAQPLLQNSDGETGMVVLESRTGFSEGGRILVLGDTNIFDNNGILAADNRQLALNVATWAATPLPTPSVSILLVLAGLCALSTRRPTRGCS